MVDTTIKTKTAMLHELESIKGLLLEDDDIPILQEVENIEAYIPNSAATFVSDNPTHFEATAITAPRVFVEEQQDFFESLPSAPNAETSVPDNLLDTLEELEKHTVEVTADKFASDAHRSSSRPSLAKATGENPFLPAHIRSRLHGNNPPPLYAQETARKIASTSVPSRQLGNTSIFSGSSKGNSTQQDIIDTVIKKLMPEIEKELRLRLETMSKHILEELNKQ